MIKVVTGIRYILNLNKNQDIRAYMEGSYTSIVLKDIVAYTVIDADGATLARELGSLDAIKDHNPKYLLTMDFTPMTSHNGIKQINALEWLLR